MNKIFYAIFIISSSAVSTINPKFSWLIGIITGLLVGYSIDKKGE